MRVWVAEKPTYGFLLPKHPKHPSLSVSKIFYGSLGMVLRIFGDFVTFDFFSWPVAPLEVGPRGQKFQKTSKNGPKTQKKNGFQGDFLSRFFSGTQNLFFFIFVIV